MPYLSKDEIQFAINRLPPLAHDSANINVRSLAGRVLKKPTMFVSPQSSAAWGRNLKRFADLHTATS